MSILDEINAPTVDPAVEVAEQLKEHLKQTYRYVVAAFTEGAELFWANPQGIPAQDIAAALGTSGQEIFALHGQLGQFIASVKPDAVVEGLSFVGQFEYNADGSVTVVEESANASAPHQPWSPPPPEEMTPTETPLPQEQLKSAHVTRRNKKKR